MQVDILAFSVHPDDIELSCSGTLLKHIKAGYSVGIVDLTQGELGTRGNAQTRMKEAAKASKILGIKFRENLKMADGFFQNDKTHQLEIIKMIRLYKPKVVFANALTDRHPDHGRAAKLVAVSCFYAGLSKIETKANGKKQDAWRPKSLYHYIQDHYHKPDFVVDISDFIDKKIECIMAFDSQFYNPKSKEPQTPISSKEFLEFIKSRMMEYGRPIGVKYAEGFVNSRIVGVEDIFNLA